MSGVVIEDVYSRSFLAPVRAPVLRAIRRRAVVHHHPGGGMIVSEAEHGWTGIVLEGMARVYITTKVGRQITLAHPGPGRSIGVGALLGEGAVSAQAVTQCSVLRLDTEQILKLAREDASLGFAIAREMSALLVELYRGTLIREEGSVRQRLARQLLDFAGELDPDPLVLPMSHQQIADAVGSAREVVSRQLSRFQEEQMLTLGRGVVRLVDPLRLEGVARNGASDSNEGAAQHSATDAPASPLPSR